MEIINEVTLTDLPRHIENSLQGISKVESGDILTYICFNQFATTIAKENFHFKVLLPEHENYETNMFV